MSSESQDNNSTTEQVVYDLDAIVDTKKIISISTTALRENAKVQESLAPVISSIGSMFAGLQKSSIFASSIQASLEATKAITAHIAPTMQSIQPFAELMSNMAIAQDGFAKQLLGALDIARSISKQLQESILPLKRLLSPIQSLQKGWFGHIAQNIGSSIHSILSTVGSLSPPSFLGNIQQFIAPILNVGRTLLAGFDFKGTFSRLFEWIRILTKSNFYLVMEAANGNEVSLMQLGKMWWRIKNLHYAYCKKLGRQPSETEFGLFLQQHCQDFVRDNEYYNPLTGFAQAAFWYIIGVLEAEYILVAHNTLEYDDNKVDTGGYHISVHYDQDYGQTLFTKTAAQEVALSQQTIRNWERKGLIEGVCVSYAHELKGFVFPALLLPYEPRLIDDLNAIKRQNQKKMRHERDGLYTTGYITKRYGTARKTLTEWDKKGILPAERIDGIRYYTQEQIDQIPKIYESNNSPRYRHLIQQFN